MYKRPEIIVTLFPDYYLFTYKTPDGEEVVLGRFNPNFSLSELLRFAERKVPVMYFSDKEEKQES